MIEDRLEKRLRRLPSQPVPPSPWLEDHVMAAVGAEAAKLQTDQARHRMRFNLAGVAAVVIAALVVGLLIGSRLSGQQAAPTLGVAPSRDAGIVRYRATVDGDMRAIENAFVNGQCDSRAQCLAMFAQTRAAADRLRSEMETMVAPTPVSGYAEGVIAADDRFIVQLDAATAVMSQPNSDYVAAALTADIGDLEMAVAELDCWPAVPVQTEHGINCS